MENRKTLTGYRLHHDKRLFHSGKSIQFRRPFISDLESIHIFSHSFNL